LTIRVINGQGKYEFVMYHHDRGEAPAIQLQRGLFDSVNSTLSNMSAYVFEAVPKWSLEMEVSSGGSGSMTSVDKLGEPSLEFSEDGLGDEELFLDCQSNLSVFPRRAPKNAVREVGPREAHEPITHRPIAMYDKRSAVNLFFDISILHLGAGVDSSPLPVDRGIDHRLQDVSGRAVVDLGGPVESSTHVWEKWGEEFTGEDGHLISPHPDMSVPEHVTVLHLAVVDSEELLAGERDDGAADFGMD